MSKGDKQRPTDHDAYSQGYDRIFGSREEIGPGVRALYEFAARTGWPPGLLQDDSKELSRWLASRPDARRIVRETLELLGDKP